MEWKKLLCDERIRSFRRQSAADLRTEFEKDYHRIIGSASFRRLQDKTQVFPLDRSDFVRTRLTHSLEVSSLAKSLGQNIGQKIQMEIRDDSFLPEHKAAVCDILQCAGLLHDIGNPPFGHFGEAAIQDWFRKNLKELEFKGKPLTELLSDQMIRDFYHFEGNTQAFRVVTRLHFLVDEHGMNLTKALLGTIIKYPVSSVEIDKESGDIRTKKMGYFFADRENFWDVQEATGTNGRRHPLAFLLEAADDIAYRTADIEDAVKKGCISYETLFRELTGYRAKEQGDAYKRVVSWLEEQMIAGVTDSFVRHYGEIMAGTYGRDLASASSMGLLMEALGDIAYRYAFQTRPILQLEIGAQRIFEFLLERFVDAVLPYDTELPMTQVQEKLVALISENYRRIYKLCSQGKGEELLVTDYICGMTDSYARDMYQELNGIYVIR